MEKYVSLENLKQYDKLVEKKIDKKVANAASADVELQEAPEEEEEVVSEAWTGPELSDYLNFNISFGTSTAEYEVLYAPNAPAENEEDYLSYPPDSEIGPNEVIEDISKIVATAIKENNHHKQVAIIRVHWTNTNNRNYSAGYHMSFDTPYLNGTTDVNILSNDTFEIVSDSPVISEDPAYDHNMYQDFYLEWNSNSLENQNTIELNEWIAM